MNGLIDYFKYFLLEDPQAIAMREEFQPVLTGSDLTKSRQVKEVI